MGRIGKARHEWSPVSKDQLFGVEPRQAEPRPDHRAAVESCRETIRAAQASALHHLRSQPTTEPWAEVLESVTIIDAPT